MGTWGTGLFADDTACGVRDEYRDLLMDGLDGPAATDRLLERWKESVEDPDEGPVFWLALAATQHKLGRLEARVFERAMAAIDGGLGLERWREAGALRQRERVLAKTREQLLGPQRAPATLRRFRDTCQWEAGELIAYRLATGRHVAFRVLGHETHARGVAPVVELLDWIGADMPGPDVLRGCGVRRGALPPPALLRALSATYPEAATLPIAAIGRLLVDAGILDSFTPNELGIDPGRVGAVTDTIERLRRGDRDTMARLHGLTRTRNPGLLEPVTQLSLRRELKRTELSSDRVARLGHQAAPSQAPAGWLVVRWYELDEALGDVFGIS
jgi:hypothetical protein